VLLGLGALAGEGRIGTAGAVLALLVALTAMEPFAALRRGALEAGRTWLAARRLSPYCGAAQPPARPAAPATPDQVLRLDGVCARYPDSDVDALHGISLHLGAGERVALIGASGAGKSTLMALVAGELAPRSGVVEAVPHAWLGQRADLFQDSLRDNLRLARPEADDPALWAALEAAGLADDVRALHAGLDTRLGEGGLGLSGGQARRLAIARLLLQPHRLWLLDEPTEGLDAPIAADLLARLDALGAGRTWLIATHLRREAALADRLLLVRNGRIEAECRRGSPGFDATLASLRPDAQDSAPPISH
jgi:ATP-binding cassette subfamily C protein CydC